MHEIHRDDKERLDTFVIELRTDRGMKPRPGDPEHLAPGVPLRPGQTREDQQREAVAEHNATMRETHGWRREHTRSGMLKFNSDGTMSDAAVEEAMVTPEEQALIDLQAAIDASVSNG